MAAGGEALQREKERGLQKVRREREVCRKGGKQVGREVRGKDEMQAGREGGEVETQEVKARDRLERREAGRE